jgi:hypothetical protein
MASRRGVGLQLPVQLPAKDEESVNRLIEFLQDENNLETLVSKHIFEALQFC